MPTLKPNPPSPIWKARGKFKKKIERMSRRWTRTAMGHIRMKAARSPRRRWKDASGPENGRKRETIAKENLKSCSQKTVQRPKANGGTLGLARSPTFPLACTAAHIFSNDAPQKPILKFHNPDNLLQFIPLLPSSPSPLAGEGRGEGASSPRPRGPDGSGRMRRGPTVGEP